MKKFISLMLTVVMTVLMVPAFSASADTADVEPQVYSSGHHYAIKMMAVCGFWIWKV